MEIAKKTLKKIYAIMGIKKLEFITDIRSDIEMAPKLIGGLDYSFFVKKVIKNLEMVYPQMRKLSPEMQKKLASVISSKFLEFETFKTGKNPPVEGLLSSILFMTKCHNSFDKDFKRHLILALKGIVLVYH